MITEIKGRVSREFQPLFYCPTHLIVDPLFIYYFQNSLHCHSHHGQNISKIVLYIKEEVFLLKLSTPDSNSFDSGTKQSVIEYIY